MLVLSPERLSEVFVWAEFLNNDLVIDFLTLLSGGHLGLSQISILEKINQLKQVDRMVDISKSTLQLEILLSLNTREAATVVDIVSILGQRRKAVTDALRKLKNKGLIEQSSDGKFYKLTENGSKCIRILADFMGDDKPKINIPRMDHLDSLPLTSVAAQIIMIMGTSKDYRMSLKDIAQTVGLSPQRIQSYLDLYVDGEPKLFKRYTDESSLSKTLSKLGIKLRRYETYYALTKEGLMQFYRLPTYTKLKQSLAYRVLSKITGTSNPKSIFRRLNFLLYGCGLLSAISITLQLSPMVPFMWALFSASVGLITIADLFLYRSF